MSKSYLPYDPDQQLLLPQALQEWLPEDHLAYFISDVVDQLDLSEIADRYERERRGGPPYNPLMMVKALLYAYCVGVPSSRRMARRLHEDIAFRVLAANNTPDFRTIADFRKDHLEALSGLFLQVLMLCQQSGLVKLGHVALEAEVQAAAEQAEAEGKEHSGVPEDKAQRDFTDPQSRIMPASGGKDFLQAYNCQAVVDHEHQVIVATRATNVASDKQQAAAMIAETIDNIGTVPKEVSADASYYSAQAVADLQALGVDPYVAPEKTRHGHQPPPAPRGRIPRHLSPRDRMRRKLQTKRGRQRYALRMATVEPVFGRIKQGRGFRQFLLRGLHQVQGEWSLICTGHNLLKLFRNGILTVSPGSPIVSST